MIKRLSTSGALVLLIILGFGIKGWYIDETGIGTDESFSIYSAQATIAQIITTLNKGDNPPLWEIILHYWNGIWGVSLFASRVLSLVFNVLTVIPLYFIGERYVGRHVGLVASILFLFSSFGLFIAQEARVYSLIGLLVTTSSLLFLSLRENPYRLLTHFLLAVVNMLIFYGHYLGVWIIIIQLFSLALIPSFRSSLQKKHVFQYILLGMLCVPQLPTIWQRLMTSGTDGTWISKSEGIADLYYMILKYSNAPVLAVLFILLSLAAIVYAFSKRDKFSTIIYLTFWLWVPLILSFLLSYQTGFFLDRYFYFVTPALYLLAASCIHMALSSINIAKWSAYSLLSIGMLSGLKLHSSEMRYSGYHKDVRPLSRMMVNHLKQENAAVIITPEWFAKDIVYYYDYKLFTSYFDEFKNQAKFKAPLKKLNIYCTSASIASSKLAIYDKILMIDENQNNVYLTDAIQVELDNNFHLDSAYIKETRRIFQYTHK